MRGDTQAHRGRVVVWPGVAPTSACLRVCCVCAVLHEVSRGCAGLRSGLFELAWIGVRVERVMFSEVKLNWGAWGQSRDV